MADLDHADGRVDAHVAGDAQRAPGRLVDDRVEQGILAEAGLRHPGVEGGAVGEGPSAQIGERAAVAVRGEGGEEVVAMAPRIDRLHAAAPSFHGRARRTRHRLPVGQRRPDRLPQVVQARPHRVRLT